jgi:hypothetical protein
LIFAFYDAANGGIKEADTSSLGDSMLCTRNNALWRIKTGPESMQIKILWKWVQVFALIVSFSMPCFAAMAGSDNQHPKAPPNSWPGSDNKWAPPGPPGLPPGGWQDGFKNWPGQGDWKETYKKRLEDDSKKLESAKGAKPSGKEYDFIFPAVSKLLEQSKEERENPFRLNQLLFASEALLNAGDFILWSRKTNQTPQDYWGVINMAIQGCYFRIQQADFFAPLSGEKNSEQYVKLARSLYQQARGAYDDRNYDKALNLSKASESILIALESIAQAAIPIPKPPPPPPIHK